MSQIIGEQEVEHAHESSMVRDVLSIMRKRGVRHVYQGFTGSLLGSAADAQRLLRDQVYPRISDLAFELRSALAPADILWGVNYEGVLVYGSKALGSPTSWGLDYLLLPFWPKSWPTAARGSGSGSWWAILYAMVDILNVDLAVGFTFGPKTVQTGRATWAARADELAAALQQAPAGSFVVTDSGNLADRIERLSPTTVTSDWVRDNVCRSGRAIRVELTLEPDANLKACVEAMITVRDFVDEHPIVLELARTL